MFAVAACVFWLRCTWNLIQPDRLASPPPRNALTTRTLRAADYIMLAQEGEKGPKDNFGKLPCGRTGIGVRVGKVCVCVTGDRIHA